MQNTKTFVIMFVDGGTFGGRLSNNISQIGGWPVYVFLDAVVFLTMPLGDRLEGLGGLVIEALKDSTGAPGPNREYQEKARKVQEKILEAADRIVFEEPGEDHVEVNDLRQIPGAVVVPISNIKRVVLKPSGLLAKTTSLLFEMREKDPDVPFRERKLQRLFTFSNSAPLTMLEELSIALRKAFGDLFEDHIVEQLAPAPIVVSGLPNPPSESFRLVHENFVNRVSLSPDGKWLITAGSDKRAHLWDTVSGEERVRVNLPGWVMAVALSPDGHRFAAAGVDGRTIHIGDLANLQNVVQVHGVEFVTGLAFSPDGSCLASSSGVNVATVFDVATGRMLKRLAPKGIFGLPSSGVLMQVVFSPDGSHIATGGRDKLVRIWNVNSGREVQRMRHEGPVGDVVFSPDGLLVASAGLDDKTARLWSRTTGAERFQLRHQGSVTGVAFNTDGTLLATASNDRTVRLWNCSTGKEVYRLTMNCIVNDVTISRDGTVIATANADKTARIWRM